MREVDARLNGLCITSDQLQKVDDGDCLLLTCRESSAAPLRGSVYEAVCPACARARLHL